MCFEDRGFCRDYVGVRGSQKPCEWAYFSAETLRLLEEQARESVDRNSVRRYAKRHGLLPPKHMRKVAWRPMVRAMPREEARFIQSLFGELRVSEPTTSLSRTLPLTHAILSTSSTTLALPTPFTA